MKKIASIHFVGIKGVGMTPLAIIAKEAGFKVSGCDIDEKFITDEVLIRAKIVPLVGFSKEHLKNVDLIVTTGAHGGYENPEVVVARQKGIEVWTQGQAVGEFMKGKILGKDGMIGISVAGSHGKTTTTAILATILREGGLDPSFVVGTGDIPILGMPGHFGRGKYFIAEADEYATEPKYDKTAKFFWQHPKIAILTNIEFDHPDLYPSLEGVRLAFSQFTNRFSSSGVIIANGDDPELQKLLKEYSGRSITFGRGEHNDFILKRVSISEPHTFFWVESLNTNLGEFALKVIGEHNAMNAAAALIASIEVGLDVDVIRDGLGKFSGTKRRSEYIGRLKTGAMLFDDYAHHPTEIRKTLLAFKQSYPKSRIVCIFQPHTYSRTKKLFDEFIYSFSYANSVILTNIYPSVREKPDPQISSNMLVDKINRLYGGSVFLPELADVVEYIEQKRYGEDTIIITMGAGDIYKVGYSLIASSV